MNSCKVTRVVTNLVSNDSPGIFKQIYITLGIVRNLKVRQRPYTC